MASLPTAPPAPRPTPPTAPRPTLFPGIPGIPDDIPFFLLIILVVILFPILLSGGNSSGGKRGSRRGRRRRRVAVEDRSQCQLLETKGAINDEAAAQKDLQDVMAHMEQRTNFSVDTLRSLYTSLLSGLVVDEENGTKQEDIELLVDDALASIDLNKDGIIDAKEMGSIQLPRETGEFLFDDVVACTSSNFKTASGEACVTPSNVVDFLNQFYGGTEVVSTDLAKHIADKSGPDACYTRAEFETVFGAAETLSAGFATQPDLFFAIASFGAGAAFSVSGLFLPF